VPALSPNAPLRSAATSTNGTAERILDSALRALARHGSSQFSMSDIGREAGISRRTLYRYFRNREDVLQAVAVHIGSSFAKAVDEAIAAHPDLDDRLSVVLGATVNYEMYDPAAIAVLRLEPGFTREFIEGTLQHYVDVVRDALEPAVSRVQAVANGSVSLQQLAEIVLRLGLSAFFLHSDGAAELPDTFARLLAENPLVIEL
jgi:AcrR family transcriptional regulator